MRSCRQFEKATTMTTSFRLRLAWAALPILILAATTSFAQSKSWDQTANIKSSALHLASLQQAKGALGAYEFIANCYKTHELNSKYGAALEGCLVQDYIHSKVTAAVYAQLPVAERERLSLPDPQEMVATMLKRVGKAMGNYKIAEADARKFVAAVETVGIPTFAKARFPQAE
jgi:hypothetical protein